MTVLCKAIYAQTTPTIVYTNNTQQNVIIDGFKAFNNDTQPRVIQAFIVPQGSVADNSSRIMSVPIPAGQTWMSADLVGEELDPMDTLYIQGEVAMMISLHGTGRGGRT